eukprot:CAMPEP_0119411722 /NCGR_PEP_ID=MMETSP1335-20130426/4382_1 /TAXON_ID=259385 /ORGANISM="Chrysoculter rhomboideus, Strain RCC1486" /LENGTH=290 /DNA_ID=CAMNT_0007436391 /DNA_START=44 /DNA_END=916 /DNA_ORIENTATION=+
MAAQAIGRDLHAARGRIARLERLSKATSLFNDPVAEINQLTLLLKQDVTRLGSAVDALAKAPVSAGRHPAMHRDAVVTWLRAELTAASGAFRTALAEREASLSAREQRAARLASVATTPALPLATASALRQRSTAAALHGRVPPSGAGVGGGGPNGRRGSGDVEAGGSVAIDLEGLGDAGGGAQQAQSLWTPRSRVEREAALTTMQSTLTELGSMFQRLSGLVAEQAQSVARIDADVDATALYVDDAQTQLQKYYRHIRGNRGLIIKAFIVLFIVMAVYAVVARARRGHT